MCIYGLLYKALLITNVLAKSVIIYFIDLQSDIFITPNVGRPKFWEFDIGGFMVGK